MEFLSRKRFAAATSVKRHDIPPPKRYEIPIPKVDRHLVAFRGRFTLSPNSDSATPRSSSSTNGQLPNRCQQLRFKLIADCYEKRSVVTITNLPMAE